MAVTKLDCKGKKCPLPIMEIAKTAKTLAPGDILEIESTDLAFAEDVKAWCRMTGNILVDLIQGEGLSKAIIKIKGEAN